MSCLTDIGHSEFNRPPINGEIVIKTNYGYETFRMCKRRIVTYRFDFDTNASPMLSVYEEMRLHLLSEAEKIEEYINKQKQKV